MAKVCPGRRLINVFRIFLSCFLFFVVVVVSFPFGPNLKSASTFSDWSDFLTVNNCSRSVIWTELYRAWSTILPKLVRLTASSSLLYWKMRDLCVDYSLFAVIIVCRKRLDLALLIDGSGSINAYGRGNFRRCLNFVKRLVASFSISPAQTRVGIVLFSHRAWLIANFRKYRNKQSLLHAIGRIRYPRGGTKIGRAMRFAKHRLFRRRTNRRKVSVHVGMEIADYWHPLFRRPKNGPAKVQHVWLHSLCFKVCVWKFSSLCVIVLI